MTKVIDSIQDLQHIVRYDKDTDWEKYGQVKAVYSDNGLVLFNYTAECNSKPPQLWNYFEKISRGLILTVSTGDVVAKPFEKFWNYRDGDISKDTQVVEVTEKMDGSLGIVYYWDKQWWVATRGSFHSDQALFATDYLRIGYPIDRFYPDITMLVEIIYPENRVVVNYGDKRDLVLIGAINRQLHYRDDFYSMWKLLAAEFGFSVPLTLEVNTISDVVQAVSILGENEEGFVVRLEDGTRLKLKGEEYLRLHHFVSYFSFKHVVEALRDGNIEELDELCPDNYRSLYNDYVRQINIMCADITDKVWKAANVCNEYAEAFNHAYMPETDAFKLARKRYAEIVLRDYNSLSKYLFLYRDGRDITNEIYNELLKIKED